MIQGLENQTLLSKRLAMLGSFREYAKTRKKILSLLNLPALSCQ